MNVFTRPETRAALIATAIRLLGVTIVPVAAILLGWS